MGVAPLRVGVISDTHGLLRPEAVEALRGVQHIVHAGDIGNIEILRSLEEIAPVTAIRGNIDVAGPCAQLPAVEWLSLGGANLYLIHSVHDLDLDPFAAGLQVVISGHSHTPALDWQQRAGKEPVLFFNPGGAGPRRFSLPVSIGFLDIHDGKIKARHVTLS